MVAQITRTIFGYFHGDFASSDDFIITATNWLEAIVIVVIIALDAVIYYIQRFSTDRILKSLKRSTVHTVTVVRDGQEQSIEATELVLGDIVVLHEGDRVPADGRIISESGLLTNESMLTGESEAIAKDARTISGQKKSTSSVIWCFLVPL